MDNDALVEQLQENLTDPAMDLGEIMEQVIPREKHQRMIARVIEHNANDLESIRVIREALNNTAKAILLTDMMVRNMPDDVVDLIKKDMPDVQFLKEMNDYLDDIVEQEQQPPFVPPLPALVPQELTPRQRFTKDIISNGISNAMRFLPPF